MMVSVHCRKIFGIGGDLVAVFALQPFGRELDRRQRILDLVRDAPRHVGPGGGALRRHEIGDVVEGDDIAGVVCFSLSTCTLRAAHRARALDGRFAARPPDRAPAALCG